MIIRQTSLPILTEEANREGEPERAFGGLSHHRAEYRRYARDALPRYARQSQSLEVLIPVLYPKGISTGDFEEALAALVGKSLAVARTLPLSLPGHEGFAWVPCAAKL